MFFMFIFRHLSFGEFRYQFISHMTRRELSDCAKMRAREQTALICTKALKDVRTRDHVRAHLMVCFIALTTLRLIQRKTKASLGAEL